MAVVDECVITGKVVGNVEDKLNIDSWANHAGDGCKGECGVQQDFVVPPDSSLGGEQDGEEWLCEDGGRGWVCENLKNGEANRGVGGEGAHRVKPWEGDASHGIISESS